MKTWKQLISGFLALALLASLSCTVLAAEPKAEKDTASKPATQFSQWFPRLEQDPEAPEAVETVLAKMGTAIQQTKTAGGVTATLNGAIWDGDTLRLSLAVKAPNIPKEVATDTNLYTEQCGFSLPEKDWKEYVRKDKEHRLKELSKERLEESIQWSLDKGQADYWGHINSIRFSLVSREKDTLLFETWMPFENYLNQPEITLHLENIATYEDGKGDGVKWEDGKRSGPGPKTAILKGPMDFTFKLENILPAVKYKGDTKITSEDIPFQFTGFEISVYDISLDYTVLAPVDMGLGATPAEANQTPGPKAGNQSVRKALHDVIQGLWTKDGKYVDLSQRSNCMIMSLGTNKGTAGGTASLSCTLPIDPDSVTALKIGGVRVELGKLEKVSG